MAPEQCLFACKCSLDALRLYRRLALLYDAHELPCPSTGGDKGLAGWGIGVINKNASLRQTGICKLYSSKGSV